jgi:hypothetical protein
MSIKSRLEKLERPDADAEEREARALGISVDLLRAMRQGGLPALDRPPAEEEPPR